MKLQHSMAALMAAGGLILGLSVPRTGAATRYVWQDSPSPSPPYTTWAMAAHVIQEAVEAAQAGETILVTNGVYTVGAVAVGDTQTNRVALTKPIVLRSVNGPEVTVIQGAAAPDGGNGDGAIRCVYVGTNAILSGFTLTNGHAGSGGGAWCEASGVVTNCTFTGNSANDGGGVAGGILYNCTLSHNSADGSGGGATGATLDNCALSGNSTPGVGGGAYASALYNSTLTRNSAGDGGGAFAATLYSCTVTLNSAQGGGGGVGGDRSNSIYTYLYNCIVYYNTASRGPNYTYSTPNYSDSTFSFSCTSPLPQGAGNIDAEPQLASATHLSANSPCIGTGNATNISGVDIDGEPWANPPGMGSDQFTSGTALGPITVSVEAAYTNVAVGFAVPFTGWFEGRFASSLWDFGDGTIRSNQPATSHAWSAPATYTVTLRGFNESFPQGVSAQIQVTVLAQPVHYVNQVNPTPVFPYASWQTAATNIQDAVEAATLPGSLVLVTNGLYDVGGGVNESRVALTNPVALQSLHGPEVTVVVGGGEFSYLGCVYVGANAILSGFTLTNGYSRQGGGVWCESSGTLSNCVIQGNSAGGIPGVGGGAFGGTLSNCALTGNSVGGAHNAPGYGGGVANAALYNCVLERFNK